MRLPAGLLEQASAWREAIRAQPAQRFGLFHDDRHVFTAVLFAAWAEGRQVVLPGDNLPGTVAALAPHVDALIGDFPAPTLQPAARPAAFTWVEPDRELEGLVVFTSGSTGQPTAIPKRLRQLFDEVLTQEQLFGARFGPDAVVFSTVSHQHIYGLLCAVLWPLATGRQLTPRRLDFPEELEVLLEPQPCVLITSPAHLKRLPEGRAWKTRLRAVFSSGGPLPPEGAARSREVLGFQPVELFGSSETGGIAWREGSTAWTPLGGVEVRQSEAGTLEVRGPHLADDHWFTTADRVELGGPHFTLHGRSDRIAKIEEKRVSLELIERTACATGLLAEARVVVLEGARVTLGLVGVPSPEGRTLDRKALIDHLRERLADAVERVAIPRRYRFVNALPVNPQGKVTDAGLRAAFEEAPAEAPQPAAPPPPPAYERVLPPVRWLDRQPAHAELELDIPPNLQVLDGHFPGTPVVPGVAQLTWAVDWAREAFGLRGTLVRMEVLKFQALLVPGHVARVVLDWNAEKATLSFKFTSPTAVYSSGRVVLSA